MKRLKGNFVFLAIVLIFLIKVSIGLKIECISEMEWFNVDYLDNWKAMLSKHLMYAHFPMYDAIILFFNKLSSENILKLRYLSVIFSVGTLWILYKFTKLLYNRKVGLLAIVFLAFNPVFVYYSRQIEAYSLFTFIAILNLYLFYKCILKKKKSLLVGYWVVTFIFSITHLYAGIIILSEVLFVFFNFILKKNISERKWFLKLVSLPFCINIIQIFIFFYYSKGNLGRFANFYVDSYTCYMPAFYWPQLSFNFMRNFLGLPKYAVACVLPFFVYAIFILWDLFNRNKEKDIFLLLRNVIIFSILAEIMYNSRLMLNNSLYFNIRHFVFLTPLLAFILAIYAASVFKKKNFRGFLFILFFPLLFIFNILYSFELVLHKQIIDYNLAVTYLKNNLADFDIITFPICWQSGPLFYYLTYGDRNKLGAVSGEPVIELTNTKQEKIKIQYLMELQVKEISKDFFSFRKNGAKRLWFLDSREEILGFPQGNNVYNEYILEKLKKNYKIIELFKMPFLDIYLFEL